MSLYNQLISIINIDNEFQEFYNLLESSVAAIGEWDGDPNIILNISKMSEKVINKFWKDMKNIDKLLLDEKVKHFEFKMCIDKDKIICKAGTWVNRDDTRDFVPVIALIMNKYKKDIFNDGTTIYRTSKVLIREKYYRGLGLAECIYTSLVKSGYSIVSDSVQYDGARNLWRKLSKKFNVCVWDHYNKKIIKTNHKINNTDIENLDKEWSEDPTGDEADLLFLIRGE